MRKAFFKLLLRLDLNSRYKLQQRTAEVWHFGAEKINDGKKAKGDQKKNTYRFRRVCLKFRYF